MATITLRDDNRRLDDAESIAQFLAQFGIWYRRFDDLDQIRPEATDTEVLALFDAPIQEQNTAGGYVTADVINIKPSLDGLQAMLDRFSHEHYHTEDEVRFIVEGRGLFHIHPKDGPVFSIEVVKGDMINVPRGTHHWFDLCEDRCIRAIRLFQDKTGWTPHYTGTGTEAGYLPMCFGPAFIPPAVERM